MNARRVASETRIEFSTRTCSSAPSGTQLDTVAVQTLGGSAASWIPNSAPRPTARTEACNGLDAPTMSRETPIDGHSSQPQEYRIWTRLLQTSAPLLSLPTAFAAISTP